MSKARVLRELVARKLAAATQEILAAVDGLVAGYEAEASGFRVEIERQRRQLELLLRTHDVMNIRSVREEEEDDAEEPPQDGNGGTSSRCPRAEDGGGGVNVLSISSAAPEGEDKDKMLVATRGENAQKSQSVQDAGSCSADGDRWIPGNSKEAKDEELETETTNKQTNPNSTESGNVDGKVSVAASESNNVFASHVDDAVGVCGEHPESFVSDHVTVSSNKTPLESQEVCDAPKFSEELKEKRSRSCGVHELAQSGERRHSCRDCQGGIESNNTFALLACSHLEEPGRVRGISGERPDSTEALKDHLPRCHKTSEFSASDGDDHMATDANATQHDGDICDAGLAPNEHRQRLNNAPKEKTSHLCDNSRPLSGETPQSCRVCGRSFSLESDATLVRHAWSHVDDAGSACGVCGERQQSAEALRDHLQNDHKSNESCDDHKDLDSNEMPHKNDGNIITENHQKVTEEIREKKSHLCGVCGKSLSDYRSLSRHKMTHSGERPHSCRVCGRSFKLAGTLRQHEKIHKDRERSYLCDVCCKMFLTAKQLQIHMRTHTDERPFRCGECRRGFNTKDGLNVHMRVHTGEAPYRCADCGWAFKRRSNLNNHVTIHSGVKAFVCVICGKACARKTHLNVHMRTHNGERPYKCQRCDKAFTQSHCLKTHMRSHLAAEAPT